MRLAIFTTFIILATAASAAPAVVGLDRKNNATKVPLTKRPLLLKDDNTLDLDALHSHARSVNAKILRGIQNYERNTGLSHSLAVKRKELQHLEDRYVGDAELRTHHDGVNMVWYTSIKVGSTREYFDVEIDTGSSDLFLPGPSCTGCTQHDRWDPNSSSSSRSRRRTFSINFEDGAYVSGIQWTDDVTMVGFTAETQTIGVATQYSSRMTWPPDGLLGMAFRSISTYPADPFFETLVDAGELSSPVFSVYLTSDGGELYLGGMNDDYYEGEVIYTHLTEVGHWQVEIDAIEADGEASLREITAIVDTGSHMIFGDASEVADLHWALGGEEVGNGYFSFPCDEFPRIGFYFGGSKSFDIPRSVLNQGRVRSGSSDCFSGIVGLSGTPHWILGAVFLQSVYTVFDFGNERVGFADLA